ncbi:MAG: fumarylacetoacetate hydrolase family protein [Chitinophagaceae bacterium]|nr:fumarylacetoacetate hydrolase family protein [Rubrivivax sp.]
MRFVSFRGLHGQPVAGVLRTDDRVADLSHASFAAALDGHPPSVDLFVEQGLACWAARLAEAGFDETSLRPLADLRLQAPLRPGKVVGAAFNFTDALAERGMAPPKAPVTFVRSGSTVIGPGQAIEVPPDVGHVGYEAELAVVIGRRALAVKRDDAMRFVAGYTIHNDVSGSSLVKQDGHFVRGKNLRASAPLGPWLATVDEVPDPYAVSIRLEMGGRLLQNGSTATMLFDVAALIEAISHQMPLEPGDVIATGTPAGVAAMHQPEAWLLPGATVNIELSGLGRLSNPVRAGAPFLET